MLKENVGAGVLNIITESLYDKPIVVFREYVQNSVDSFKKAIDNGCDKNNFYSKIWYKDNSLFFIDNGYGVQEIDFVERMKKIAFSNKNRLNNIGYKGIGRLSGLSYCKKLIFINIISYSKDKFQVYEISAEKYHQIKNEVEYSEMDYAELIDRISEYKENIDTQFVKNLLNNFDDKYFILDTGFLVVLENINTVLDTLLKDKDIITELGWLLPVDFKSELFESEYKDLLIELTSANEDEIIPAYSYKVYYNDVPVERPISSDMLRQIVWKADFNYAVGMYSFNSNKIEIDKKNAFSGIKIYLDNVLLCNEIELIDNLKNLGLIGHTTNELLQSVRAIGAIIYITDKVNIYANARRTFIEIVDEDSIDFLKTLAEFIEKIYKARYALSKYISKNVSINFNSSELNTLKTRALEALNALSEEIVDIKDETIVLDKDKSNTEKKQGLKKIINRKLRKDINDYLKQVTVDDIDNEDIIYEDFKIWLTSN